MTNIDNDDFPDLSPEDYEWAHFLAPYGNYFPENHGLCRSEGTDWSQCCTDAESCRETFLTQHVDRVVDLGATSVRLVGLGFNFTDDGRLVTSCERLWDDRADEDQAAGRGCALDLSVEADFDRYIAIVRETVRLLGARGLRTILLTQGKGADDGENHFVYANTLGRVAEALADEPWLLGYDPMNEPVYFYRSELVHQSLACSGGGFCKEAAQAITKDWFEALTDAAPHHFVTLGQGNTTLSLIHWDPHLVYDHFTSWHLYPPHPWDEGAVPHGRVAMGRQLYHAALGGCGRPCPFVGEEDDIGCHVASTPLTAETFIWNNGFYYKYLPGGDPCPIGHDDGANCQAGAFDRGRDTAFSLRQPFFYVSAQAGDCPPEATFDGANCRVATGPIGADGDYGDVDGVLSFTWEATHGDPPCDDPVAGGEACVVGPVPEGWSPFVIYRTHFYVEPVTCWPRRPLHLGETGFSVFPNGWDLDPAAYTGHPRRWAKYSACVDDSGDPRPDTHPAGTEAEQVDFLLGDDDGWPGLFGMSQACGFQGMHWWPLGGVNWGHCREDNFGLYAFWYLHHDAPPSGDPREIVRRLGADAFEWGVDYTAPPQGWCEEPPGFRGSMERDPADPTHRFVGTVRDSAGAPVANAMFYAWGTGWVGLSITFTDADGHFAFEWPGCLVQGGATDFGRTTDLRDLSGSCPSGGAGVTQVDLGTFVIDPHPDVPSREALAPPGERQEMCLYDGGWVPSE